jgi:hypothetical protein
MNVEQAAHWATITFLAFALASGAVGELTRQWDPRDRHDPLGV